MNRFLIPFLVLLLNISVQAVDLKWYKYQGSNMAISPYEQVFTVVGHGVNPNGSYTLSGPGTNGYAVQLVNGSATFSHVFTAVIDNAPQGWVFTTARIYTGGAISAVFRSAGVKRAWTIVSLDDASPPAAPKQTEYFTINLYPPGTDLDEVDPLPNEKAKFGMDVVNNGDEPVEMRLMVDGKQEGTDWVVEPGVTFKFDYEKEKMERGQEGTYEWQKKDANGNWVRAGGGTYTASGGDSPVINLRDQLVVNNNKPPDPIAPKPTPSPTPTPAPPVDNPVGGNLPGAPGGGASPTPKDRTNLNVVGGSGPNGEITEKDIYTAVKAALEDADDGTPTPAEGEEIETNEDTIDEVRDAAEELGNKLGEVADQGEAAADSVVGKIDEYLGTLGTMPTSFGSRASFVSGTFSLPNGGKLGPLVINFGEWHASIIREIALWVLRVTFFILGIKAVNYN